MRVLRLWLGMVGVGAALCACGSPDSATPQQAALPTADIVILPIKTSQVVPLTFTPAPSATLPSPAVPTPAPSPAPTLIAEVLDAAPADNPAAALEAELIVEINKVRQANGLPPYAASPELSAAARAHSCDLAAHHMISHTSSDGRDLAARLAGSVEKWEWPSESIAAGTDDPVTVVAWWMNEPPEGWHRRNILDSQQQEVGVGYCFAADDPSGNHSYWTADFSRRSPGP